jgi:hypothetical protein
MLAAGVAAFGFGMGVSVLAAVAKWLDNRKGGKA